MIVADTSALVLLATVDTLSLVLEGFDVHSTDTVVEELEDTAKYDDVHGEAARVVLANRDRLAVHDVGDPGIRSSRIDDGEASCLILVRRLDATFLLTDDLRALPELGALVDARVALSPIVLKALVDKDVLDRSEARNRPASIAERRDWLGAPIYRRARKLFERDSG